MEGEGKRARQQRDSESVVEVDCCRERERDSFGNKIDRQRKTNGVNVRLISGVIENVANDVVPTICIFSLLVYKRHLDPMTSCKSLILAT